MLTQAMTFAIAAHKAVGQVRKYTGEPYHRHPADVVRIVKSTPGHTEEMLCAAWLHDVVEDTAVTIADIDMMFGRAVAKLVEELTDVSKPDDGNRAERKALDRAHTAKASPQAKTIKLADLISNSRSIMQHDPGFAAIYIPEKRLLLDVLQEGDQALLAVARNLVEESGF